jgi:predicted ATPase/DNA-binding CsgD family transcriptional regulator
VSPPENNLPFQLTSLVGREREIAEVGRLLTGARLLTLTGPGGSGKTRLALATAADLVEDYEDGVWLVELAPLSDPDLVPQAVASVLGVREVPGTPLVDSLCLYLGARGVLLVLDNCEHLVGACARLAEILLHSCPNLRILATSREALGVSGETLFAVPPLSLPDPRRVPAPESLSCYEAARLFVERAQAAKHDFSITEGNAMAVAQVCYRLDGIPLAIELAAARVKVLSVEQISSRLDDSFRLLTGGGRWALAHQRTLRTAMDWSHDLLSEEERAMLRRLSAFAGGFTLEAAEAVGEGEGIEGGEVLDLLSTLVDKSLVVVEEQDGEMRYRLLETVRQYGREKLAEAAEAERVRRQHVKYYLALAEEAEPAFTEQVPWLERLETEYGNLRTALSWSLGPEDAEGPAGVRVQLGLRLASTLAQGRFWNSYGPGEGRRWLQRALAGSGTSTTPARAKALNQAGLMAMWQGDTQQSAALLEEGRTLFEELGDGLGVANSLVDLGQLALRGGDRKRTRALREEGEALRPRLSDRQAMGFLLLFLGGAAIDEGDHDRAVGLLEEGLELNRELGDTLGTALCLASLGIVALEQDDPERAAALYEEDLRLLRSLRDKAATAFGLRGMACVAALRGDAARAARLWGAGEALGEAINLPLSPFDRAHPDYEGLLNGVRPRLEEIAWEAALAEGRAMTPEVALEYALQPPAAPEEPSSPPSFPSGLSAREVEVLGLVARGMTDPQVAEELYISPRTVNAHLRSVYHKIGSSTRAEATRFALEHDLL